MRMQREPVGHMGMLRLCRHLNSPTRTVHTLQALAHQLPVCTATASGPWRCHMKVCHASAAACRICTAASVQGMEASPAPAGPTRLWIDCDAGVDDAHALLMATVWPSTNIEAVSCVHGNVGVAQVAANVARVMAAAGRPDVPVYLGAGEPLLSVSPREPSTWFGRDGLGDAPHARPRPADVSAQPAAGHAAVRLVEAAQAAEGSLVVVALGPLTNIALALKLDPGLPLRLSRLIIMGGAEAVGNVTPTAEFNFHADAHAAALVLAKWSAAAGSEGVAPLVLVTWECCERHAVPWGAVDMQLGRPTPRARFLAAISDSILAKARCAAPSATAATTAPLPPIVQTAAQPGGCAVTAEGASGTYSGEEEEGTGAGINSGWATADPLAMAVALDPGAVLASRQVAVVVETGPSTHTHGMAVFDWQGLTKAPANVQLVTRVDMGRYNELLDRALD